MDKATLDRLVALFPRFASMSSGELEELLRKTGARTVKDKPRDYIIRKGVPVQEFSCLLSGWATRYVVLPDGRRQILAFKTPGSFICVHALCMKVVPFSVQAVTATERLAMDIEALIDAVSELPVANQIFYAIGCHDLSDAEDKMIGLGRRDAIEKISRLIAKLYARLHETGVVEKPAFEFPLRQTHIADATGLTSVHVNRILKQLRMAHVVTLDKGRIVIHDLDALLEFADMTRDELEVYPILPRGWSRITDKTEKLPPT